MKLSKAAWPSRCRRPRPIWLEGRGNVVDGCEVVGLYPPLVPGHSGLTRMSYALIDHLRSVDKRRVRRAFGQLAPGELGAIDDGLALFLEFGARLEPESTPRVQ